MCSQAKEVNKATVKSFLLPEVLRVNYAPYQIPGWKHVLCAYAAVATSIRTYPTAVMIHHPSMEAQKVKMILVLYK